MIQLSVGEWYEYPFQQDDVWDSVYLYFYCIHDKDVKTVWSKERL